MSLATETPLTHRERLTRGLAHTAAGTVDVARGAVGLSGAAVRSGAVVLRRRYRPWVLVAAAGAAVLAGAAAVVLIRRSSRPQEVSPRPPSVDAQHKV
ncbi:hypothetical protein A5735_08555 [Mycolicibacter heraklionensis]|nr:hypothetical protein A5735_08555 [Mycolicibacter heraklionensis]